jgi:hypothetical protein
MPAAEIITHEKNDKDAWICLCGNQPSSDGFYPCDDSGDEIEPTAAWKGLYACLRCGRIIEQGSLRVVGRGSNPRLLV